MIRLSTGLRDFLNSGGSFKQAFTGGCLNIYTGSQPAAADNAVTGSLLAKVTISSGAHTNEVRSYGVLNFTGGGSGSLDTLTVNGQDVLGGAVSYTSSLANTMVLVAAQINALHIDPRIVASIPTAGVATMRLTAPPGMGTIPNGWVVAHTQTTITVTNSAFANGVAAVNGLKFTDSSGGVISLDGVWSGVILATDTAGWFRLCGSVVDAGTSSTSLFRLDGSIPSDMDMTATALTKDKVLTIQQFDITEPAY